MPSLRDITIVNLFMKIPRARVMRKDFQQIRLTLRFWLIRRETLLDTVNNILSMKVDMVVMRHSASGAPHFLAQYIPAAIVNAGDGINEHPTQGLLDALSIREKIGKLKDTKIAIIGDIMHSRVAMSNIYLLKKMGAEVTVCGPPTLIPKYIREAFDVNVSYNIEETLNWCDHCSAFNERVEPVLFLL